MKELQGDLEYQSEQIRSKDELEREVEFLRSFVIGSYEKTCPLRAESTKMVRWWSLRLLGKTPDGSAFNRAAKGNGQAD